MIVFLCSNLVWKQCQVSSVLERLSSPVGWAKLLWAKVGIIFLQYVLHRINVAYVC